MRQRVMDTVNALLQHSGQTVPAKSLHIADNSLQVYNVEHWPETFNSLLVHDFPSLRISIDSSANSLSGFVVTLQWDALLDISQKVTVLVYFLTMFGLVCFVLHTSVTNFQNISIDHMRHIRDLYLNGYNGTDTGLGGGSRLAEQLRSLITHSEL
jgi:hypothetical protein